MSRHLRRAVAVGTAPMLLAGGVAIGAARVGDGIAAADKQALARVADPAWPCRVVRRALPDGEDLAAEPVAAGTMCVVQPTGESWPPGRGC